MTYPKKSHAYDKDEKAAVERPVSDNPLVASLPALFADKGKLRALLAVAGALMVLVIAVAFIMGSK